MCMGIDNLPVKQDTEPRNMCLECDLWQSCHCEQEKAGLPRHSAGKIRYPNQKGGEESHYMYKAQF